jgi:4'-phosphopantetheinyl transferase
MAMDDPKIFRWLLDVDPLWPSPNGGPGSAKATAHWATGQDATQALNLLAPQERAKVLRYYRPEDAKLSLGSSLLKRRAIADTCQVAWPEVVVSEDSNRKPCYVPPDSDARTLQFNVSHHGTLVALVGCPGDLTRLGVDIVQMNWERDYAKVVKEGFEAWANVYEMVFSDREIKDIAGFVPTKQLDSQAEIRAKLRHFYAHWCLREAYVKMTGEALLAPWLKFLEFRSVIVPLPVSELPHGAQKTGEWGQTCNDIEIWFHGERVTDVNLEIQAFREDYMIATASSNLGIPLTEFKELSIERDVHP